MLSKMLYSTLSLLLVTSSAFANVEYRFNSVSNSATLLPSGVQLGIILSDAVVAAGHIDYQSPDCTLFSSGLPGSCVIDPTSPIAYFYFSVNGEPHNTITYFPQQQAMGNERRLNLSLDINAKGFLNGSIFANNTETDISFMGVNGLFTVTGVHSDFGLDAGGCPGTNTPQCFGATGTIQAVPEPGTVTLLGLAILGLFVSRKVGAAGTGLKARVKRKTTSLK